MILGRADAGKSSFCTFLINRLLEEKKRVAILDGDLGQSDIGPPSTIAYAPVTKPITDLFNLRAKNAFFIGETSPSNVTGRMVQGLSLLKKEALAGDPEFLIINTDGWIEGECAVGYKLKLVEELGPQVIYFVQQKDELGPMLEADQKEQKSNGGVTNNYRAERSGKTERSP